MAFGRGVDRPVLPAAQRQFAGNQQQHLHEPLVGGAALDLLHRQFRVLLRHHDGGAQPRVAVQPFAHDPLVHRARHGGAQVLAERRLHAVQAIAGWQSPCRTDPAPRRPDARPWRRACPSRPASRRARSAGCWPDRRWCSAHPAHAAPPSRATLRRDTASVPTAPAPWDAHRSRRSAMSSFSLPPGEAYGIRSSAQRIPSKCGQARYFNRRCTQMKPGSIGSRSAIGGAFRSSTRLARRFMKRCKRMRRIARGL